MPLHAARGYGPDRQAAENARNGEREVKGVRYEACRRGRSSAGGSWRRRWIVIERKKVSLTVRVTRLGIAIRAKSTFGAERERERERAGMKKSTQGESMFDAR